MGRSRLRTRGQFRRGHAPAVLPSGLLASAPTQVRPARPTQLSTWQSTRTSVVVGSPSALPIPKAKRAAPNSPAGARPVHSRTPARASGPAPLLRPPQWRHALPAHGLRTHAQASLERGRGGPLTRPPCFPPASACRARLPGRNAKWTPSENFWHRAVQNPVGPALVEEDVTGTRVHALADRGVLRHLIEVFSVSRY